MRSTSQDVAGGFVMLKCVHFRFAAFCFFAGIFSSLSAQDAIPADGDEVRGLTKPAAAVKAALKPYPKKWLLVVGVDYSDRPDGEKVHLPTLSNAERDAKSVYETLTKYYGFEVLDGDLLVGKAATREAITQGLEAFSDPAKKAVGEDDAVLVFFSGHGARVDDPQERGVIYPSDIVIQQGRPVGKMVKLQAGLVDVLNSCKAKHKLVVLDCCHSGEIFNRAARPYGDNTSTDQPDLLKERTFQAIASCRGSQVAADGAKGSNSPFTAALLRSLQRLPAREMVIGKEPITASRLFVSMRADLKSLRNGQSPDCRRLVDGDGEFLFWPSPSADFTPFKNSPEDFALLQAMVPGEYGKWWFDETPWFIPSLRRVILEGKDAQRTTVESLAISRSSLLALAEAAVRKMEESEDDLIKLRVKHFRALATNDDPRKFREQAIKVANELQRLSKDSEVVKLEGTDIHLLAVLNHYLSMNDQASMQPESGAQSRETLAQDFYAEALKLYEGGETKDLALAALCHCDLGNLLLLKNKSWTEAAREFETSLEPFYREPAEAMGTDSGVSKSVKTSESPAAFQIYVFVQQADAWQRQNRWGEADRCLDSALAVAQNFAPDHSLTSFVHARRAWSAMEQWQINKAAESFNQSNRILSNLSRDASSRPGITDLPDLRARQTAEFEELLAFDYDAAINYLHNEHGLAMTQRFEGHVTESAATYRAIIEKLTRALSRLASLRSANTTQLSADLEVRLYDRLVNTYERLGDCNLFGDPDLRDIKEAADDYRRAVELCLELPTDRRNQRQAGLLYRQALALAIPSSIQDVEHARQLCNQAVEVLKGDQAKRSSALESLERLAPALIRIFEIDAEKAADKDPCSVRLACLRSAISEINLQGGRSLHRDQLELLLFSAKVLVDQDLLSQERGANRFQTQQDGNLLMALCRKTLMRGVTEIPSDQPESESSRIQDGESLRYLRPYYDTVMRCKLEHSEKHVKELLEVHFEATHGAPYVKPRDARPVLAVYVLDNKGHLLIDIPRGVSKHFSLDGHCSIADLQLACQPLGKKLRLPTEVFKELAGLADVRGQQEIPSENGLASNRETSAKIDCWCYDHVRGMKPSDGGTAAVKMADAAFVAKGTDKANTTTTGFRPGSYFPFSLPNGVEASVFSR